MYLCSKTHEEICHESDECPACEVIRDLEDTLTELGKELETAEADSTRLEDEVASLEERLDKVPGDADDKS